MALRIILKTALVVAIFFALDQVYRHTFYVRELEEKYPEARQMREASGSTDIFYFGESSNVTYAPGDSSTKSISRLLNDYYPSLKVTNINKYATHAGVYRKWLEQITVTGGRPSALVVTMNLRSFGAAWIHSRLETQLKESFVLSRPLPPLLNRFMLSLQAFDSKTEQQREADMLREWRTTELQFPFTFPYRTVAQWDRAVAMGGYTRPDGSWDMPRIELACHFIKGYAFNIREDNPRIEDFDAIASWCEEKGVRCYFNLMAENVHFADSLAGKELVFLMRQNRDFLQHRYSKGLCTVVDNLERVAPASFIDKGWTTEHYDYRGRLAIAAHLAGSMKKQYLAHFKKAY